ncbi:MAG: hypothetical protein RH945_02915 [Hyphomonas sp.]
MPLRLILLAAALTALPAAAQSTDYMNGYYQHGVESGAAPQTASNMVTCATYWAVWSQSAATDWDAAFMAELDPDLRPAESELAAGYWATLANDIYMDETGDTARFEQEVGIATPIAIQAYSDLRTSADTRDRYHMFRVLGACHLTFE